MYTRLGKCAEHPKEGTLKPSLDGLVGSKMEKGVAGADRGVKPYGKRHPPPVRELRWVEKEWREMKSVGQAVARARRCYPRLSLTFILRTLVMDRGERESGPLGIGEGRLAAVKAKLEKGGEGSRDPGETSV